MPMKVEIELVYGLNLLILKTNRINTVTIKQTDGRELFTYVHVLQKFTQCILGMDFNPFLKCTV